MKVLIVDDQELIRFKLQMDLEKWGYEVVAAENGQDAWEKFQADDFRLVISDWEMPVHEWP
jgi:DNA-binding response OmpR family regulator